MSRKRHVQITTEWTTLNGKTHKLDPEETQKAPKRSTKKKKVHAHIPMQIRFGGAAEPMTVDQQWRYLKNTMNGLLQSWDQYTGPGGYWEHDERFQQRWAELIIKKEEALLSWKKEHQIDDIFVYHPNLTWDQSVPRCPTGTCLHPCCDAQAPPGVGRG